MYPYLDQVQKSSRRFIKTDTDDRETIPLGREFHLYRLSFEKLKLMTSSGISAAEGENIAGSISQYPFKILNFQTSPIRCVCLQLNMIKMIRCIVNSNATTTVMLNMSEAQMGCVIEHYPLPDLFNKFLAVIKCFTWGYWHVN